MYTLQHLTGSGFWTELASSTAATDFEMRGPRFADRAEAEAALNEHVSVGGWDPRRIRIAEVAS